MNKDQPLKNTNIYLHLRKKKVWGREQFGKKNKQIRYSKNHKTYEKNKKKTNFWLSNIPEKKMYGLNFKILIENNFNSEDMFKSPPERVKSLQFSSCKIIS